MSVCNRCEAKFGCRWVGGGGGGSAGEGGARGVPVRVKYRRLMMMWSLMSLDVGLTY